MTSQDNEEEEIPAQVDKKTKAIKEAKPKPAASAKRKAKASPNKINGDAGKSTQGFGAESQL